MCNVLLNPRQLEAFRLVMQRGSVTGAAAELRISQPAVSRFIRDLEVRSGITLFERTRQLTQSMTAHGYTKPWCVGM